MALYARGYLRLGLIDKMFGIDRTLHRQGVTGEAKTLLIHKLGMLLAMTAGTDIGGWHSQLLVIIAVTVGTENLFTISSDFRMTTLAPVIHNSRRDRAVTFNALFSLKLSR